MAIKTKIKIDDNAEVRSEIVTLYEAADHVTVSRWALMVAKYAFLNAGMDYLTYDVVIQGFATNKRWQTGDASVDDVRQAAFAVHKLARECTSDVETTVFRVAGHAIASGHMKEHAMVASDYAVKAVNLLHANNPVAVIEVRMWQLAALRSCMADSTLLNYLQNNSGTSPVGGGRKIPSNT